MWREQRVKPDIDLASCAVYLCDSSTSLYLPAIHPPHLNPRHVLGSFFRYAEEVKRNAEAAEVKEEGEEEEEEEEEAASQAASKKEQEDGSAPSAGAASAPSASSEDGGSARLADLSQCVALMMHAELIDESEGLMLQGLVEEEHFILKAAWEYYQVLVGVGNQCLNLNTPFEH